MAEKIMTPCEAMKLAIAEAKKGHGHVSPNPVVGCVILSREGHFVSSGYHKKLGGPHAEVEALRAVPDHILLNGAHVFVTLEPCSHYGRTPPCAETLSKLPIGEVTFGLVDPNPKVAGRGAEMLRAAGIKCTQFTGDREIEQALQDLPEIFLHNQRQQSPFVALKVATSLDGRMSMKSGESKWITGEIARSFSHELRAQYDAVLIGKRTFLEDDPSLNIRLAGFEDHSNSVIILDPKGETLEKINDSKLAQVRPLEKVFIATYEDVLPGPNVLRVRKNAQGQMDLNHLLELLWARDIRSIFVEGGAHTFAEFLKLRLAHRLHLFLAPTLIGGRFGVSWTEAFGSENFSERLVTSKLVAQSFGEDLYFSLRLGL